MCQVLGAADTLVESPCPHRRVYIPLEETDSKQNNTMISENKKFSVLLGEGV